MTDNIREKSNTDAIFLSDEGAGAYPARYYASFDTRAVQPTAVTGWYDTWGMSSLANVPPASEMIPVTLKDWINTDSFRLPTGRGVQNGKIVDYTPPPYMLPLKEQAQNAMKKVQQQASMVTAMEETFGPKMQAYVKTLRSIINQTDTKNTKLPTPPNEPTT